MNIYFSGIGGVAIGPLMEIALDAGYSAHGSDLSQTLMSQQLESRGVAVTYQQDGTFLRTCHQQQPIDWLVHTAALPHDHPELIAARELGIRVSKRDELLAHIIKEKGLKLLAISGTHGKTTTTGMMIWTMKQLGIPISYSVGTTLNFGPSGSFVEDSEYFIYECDEFDKNFLYFAPYLSLITTIGYDHTDTYPTKEEYYSAFRQFIHQSQSAVLWQHDANLISSRESVSWCLQADETLDLKLAGEHNRRNGTLVLKALERLGLGANIDNRFALESFPGTNRRFEKLADNLYTDYGHHPTEIAATLQMAREISDQVMLVYQPHQNIRQHEIRNEYVDKVFKNAEQVYWLPTYLSREDPELQILTTDQLTRNISEPIIHCAQFDDELWHNIESARQSGKLVLCMGAGSIDGWVRSKLNH